MARHPGRKYCHGGRVKKLISAFRFIQGGEDPHRLCVKDDGECTGKSSLPWQWDEGQYTDVCPLKLIIEAGGIHTFWKRSRDHGLPHDGGFMQQPNRWYAMITMCDDEFRRPHAE